MNGEIKYSKILPEEYLLGKPIEAEKNETDKNKFVPLFKEAIGNDKNENFTLLHEDPFFAIMQEELKRKQEIIENPVKMKDIYQEIEKLKNEKKKKKRKRIRKKKIRKKDKKKKDKKKKKEKKKKENILLLLQGQILQNQEVEKKIKSRILCLVII